MQARHSDAAPTHMRLGPSGLPNPASRPCGQTLLDIARHRVLRRIAPQQAAANRINQDDNEPD
jgi:hypothetical protein